MKKSEETALHWSQQKEQAGGYWHAKLMFGLFRFFPVIFMRIIAFPVGFFYFLFSKRARNESKRFLKRVAPFVTNPKISEKCCSPLGPLRHIISFSLALVEKAQSWGGRFKYKNIHLQDDDMEELVGDIEKGKGAILICSHLGNSEMLRGLIDYFRKELSRKITATTIIDMQVSTTFNRMLKMLNPQSGMGIIGTNEIGPDTVSILEEKLAAGELVVIAGDRSSANAANKNIMLPFLGENASFPVGGIYLAALLNAPVYIFFFLRKKDLALIPKYDIHVHKSPITFECGRKERLLRCSEMVRSFVTLLEGYCKEQPFQWYNFFDFWAKEHDIGNP